jgi:hypothetical protein
MFRTKSKINGVKKSLQLQISRIKLLYLEIMKKGNLSKPSLKSLISSGLRLSLTVIIVLLVVSSPVFMLTNPTQLLAASNTKNSASLDNSNYHSNPQAMQQVPLPSSTSSTTPTTTTSPVSSQGNDSFTAQAPLQIPRTLQSNDLVNSLAFYEVTFITSTTGVIDKIEMDFSAGTGVGAAGIIERIGIGGGTLLKSGSIITYDVTAPVSIPAGTFIRLEMFGIKNPTTPSTIHQAAITTKDSGGIPIDGPSLTNVYTIKKVGSSDLADGSVTSTKPAESFVKSVILHDDAAGHALGWDPNGVTTAFEIVESQTGPDATAFVNVDSIVAADPVCSASQVFAGQIEVWCTSPPADGSLLAYTVINVPIISP